MSELKELKTAEYQDLVNQGGVTVIDFWAPWCGYCVRMMPIIEEIAGELEGKANFVKVNADEEPELARNLQVEVLPTFVILKDGDIINVDVSTIYKGYFSDSSRMFIIGKTTPDKEKLVRVAKECVEEGIKAVKPWTFLGDMADAVNRHAKENGYSIVVDIGGHGVGLEFHEDPFVSYVTPKGTEMLMVPGMVFTIEPMVNAGTAEIYQDADNGWTIYTDDGKPSAQWEVTVAVTEDGCEVLVW